MTTVKRASTRSSRKRRRSELYESTDAKPASAATPLTADDLVPDIVPPPPAKEFMDALDSYRSVDWTDELLTQFFNRKNRLVTMDAEPFLDDITMFQRKGNGLGFSFLLKCHWTHPKERCPVVTWQKFSDLKFNPQYLQVFEERGFDVHSERELSKLESQQLLVKLHEEQKHRPGRKCTEEQLYKQMQQKLFQPKRVRNSRRTLVRIVQQQKSNLIMPEGNQRNGQAIGESFYNGSGKYRPPVQRNWPGTNEPVFSFSAALDTHSE